MTGKNGILTGHNNCITHKQSVIAWKQFQLNTKQGTSISQQLDGLCAISPVCVVSDTAVQALLFVCVHNAVFVCRVLDRW